MRGRRMLSRAGPLLDVWSFPGRRREMPKKKIIIKKKNHRSLKGILVLFKAPRSCAASTLCFGMASFGVHFSSWSSSKASAALAKGLPVPRSSMARRLPGHSPRSVPQKGHGTIWEAPGRGRGFLPPQYKVSAHHSCPNPGPVQPKNSRRSTRNFISVSYALPEVVPSAQGGSSDTLVTTLSPKQPQGLLHLSRCPRRQRDVPCHPSQAFPSPGSCGRSHRASREPRHPRSSMSQWGLGTVPQPGASSQ